MTATCLLFMCTLGSRGRQVLSKKCFWANPMFYGELYVPILKIATLAAFPLFNEAV
jgi:hypothetical protein